MELKSVPPAVAKALNAAHGSNEIAQRAGNYMAHYNFQYVSHAMACGNPDCLAIKMLGHAFRASVAEYVAASKVVQESIQAIEKALTEAYPPGEEPPSVEEPPAANANDLPPEGTVLQ